MKQVIFEYVKWQHNSATIYAALNDPKLRPTVPTVIQLTDGFSILCIPHSDTTLTPFTATIAPGYPYDVTEPTRVEVEPPKPKVESVSENTLLKAIAISRDAALALQLIKD